MVILFLVAAAALAAALADHYRLVTLPVPQGIRMEVSGLDRLSDGRIAAATRNGDVVLAANAYDNRDVKLAAERLGLDVARDREAASAGGADQRQHLVRVGLLRREMIDRDVGAFASEGDCCRAAHA